MEISICRRLTNEIRMKIERKYTLNHFFKEHKNLPPSLRSRLCALKVAKIEFPFYRRWKEMLFFDIGLLESSWQNEKISR